MNTDLIETIKKGKIILSESSIIICSIVRDCGRNLKANIKTVNSLCKLTKEYQVIIFENDSKDNTKDILTGWSKEDENILVNITDFNVEKTIPSHTESSNKNPFFSRKRIEKMAYYRNQYLEYIWNNKLEADYIIVVDLDVEKISINGIISSFGHQNRWDVISANGFSLSPKLTKRYHDSYALIECGNQNTPQSEQSIINNQYKFGFLKKQHPLFKVYSAYGGLAIYKFNVIAGQKYEVISNNDPCVEVKCEHVGLHEQIHLNGFHEFYINPAMTIKYQKVTFNMIRKTISRILKTLY